MHVINLSQGMSVDRVIELVTHRTIYPEISLQLYFLKEKCQRLMNVVTSLEAQDTPLACSVFNTLEDLCLYLLAGTTKEHFGIETDGRLANLGQMEKKRSFQKVVQLSPCKLDTHLKNHPAYDYYKAARALILGNNLV